MDIVAYTRAKLAQGRAQTRLTKNREKKNENNRKHKEAQGTVAKKRSGNGENTFTPSESEVESRRTDNGTAESEAIRSTGARRCGIARSI